MLVSEILPVTTANMSHVLVLRLSWPLALRVPPPHAMVPLDSQEAMKLWPEVGSWMKGQSGGCLHLWLESLLIRGPSVIILPRPFRDRELICKTGQ